MKNAIKLIFAAAAIFAAVSCQKEFSDISVSEGTRTYTAVLGDMTKMSANVSVDGTKISTQWDGAEMIFIADDLYTESNCPIFNVEEEKPEGDGAWLNEDGTSISIKYTPKTGATKVYAACMGKGTKTYISNGKAEHITPGFEYHGATFEETSYLAVTADVNATKLVFKPVFGLIEFSVSNPEVSVIAGSFANDAIPERFDYNFVTESLENVSAKKEFEIRVDGPGTFYIPVVPGTDVSGFEFNLYDEEEILLNKISSAKATGSIARGQVISLGEIDAHGIYKTVEKASFDVVNGNIDEDGIITFKSFKGNAGTAPANFNNGIRLYQAPAEGDTGGYVEIQSTNGNKIAAVVITTTNTYNSKIGFAVDDELFNAAEASSIAKKNSVGITGVNAHKISVFCAGTGSSGRLEIADIKVTYIADERTPQTISFPEDSYNAKTGEPFTAPVLSGAVNAVTYSSNNPAVATVDPNTGAVTPVAAGTCIIRAYAAASETLKEGYATYGLTVTNSTTGIAGIKSELRAGGSSTTKFVANVTDMVVTFSKDDVFPHVAYVEDTDGQAIYVYLGNATLPFAAGDKFSGEISGEGKVYNGCVEITSCDVSKATKTSGVTVNPVVVTLENLLANYADYEYRMIKIENVKVTTGLSSTVQSGAIEQNGTSATLRSGQKGFVTTDAGTNVDVICFPDYYNADKQLMIWKQDQVILKGGLNNITMASSRTVGVGENWTIGATCLSGDPVSYEITSGSDVISITAGVVTGIKAGTATIKATSIATGLYSAAEATCTVTVSAAGGETTLTTTVSTWLNEHKDVIVSAGSNIGTKVSSIDFDSNITISVAGTGNTGTFWGTSPSNDWRIYSKQGEEATVSITAKNSKKIKSIKFTFNTSNGGGLKYGSTSLTSGTALSISPSASTIELSVPYSSGKTGQARITAVEIIYE